MGLLPVRKYQIPSDRGLKVVYLRLHEDYLLLHRYERSIVYPRRARKTRFIAVSCQPFFNDVKMYKYFNNTTVKQDFPSRAGDAL